MPEDLIHEEKEYKWEISITPFLPDQRKKLFMAGNKNQTHLALQLTNFALIVLD
jgi:hypothetical protein